MQEAANLLSTLFIIPSINREFVYCCISLSLYALTIFVPLDYANSGIEIPTVDGLSLINASLVFGEVHVYTNIHYKCICMPGDTYA